MTTPSEIQKIVFVGDYVPRQCGIATFTADVCKSVAAQYPDLQCLVVPVNDIEGGYDYPPEVRFEIEEQELASYQRAADFLNISEVDIVCVQHEYGIYGGAAGGHLLALLRDIKTPIVTTLHTVLTKPNADQRRVTQELAQLSTRLVVMTQKSEALLREVYRVPPGKVDIIPHGIPDMPFVDPNFYKDHFGVEGKQVLLTFGLLSPSKGIEYVLQALPAILKEFPNVVYIVLGATHPNLVREQGEIYRLSLERLARVSGIDRNVIFYNRFVDIGELKEFIGAADVYVTPYLNEAQVVSGTLAYTFGAGKAVVSTPYWHAQELLAENRGVLVPFRDASAIAEGIAGLLRDETRRHAIRKNAYKLGREMIWSNVAHLYMQSFERARREVSGMGRRLFSTKTLGEQLGQLPEIKLDHLLRMTDSTGVFQHAVLTFPNFSEGYCTDDNARALILAVLLDELGHESTRLRNAASIYMAFLHHALDSKIRRFRNFMQFDRHWSEEAGSEDSHGRALWALGTCVGRSTQSTFQTVAGQLFERALPAALEFKSPRAYAFALIGIHEYLRRLSGDRLVNQVRETLAAHLMRLYRQCAQEDWPWFEESVTYVNAKMPHALILTGRWTNQPEILETGLGALRWLMRIQTSEGGYFRPIGTNGFYKRGQPRAQFDQQPIEAYSMISAALEAFRSTGDHYWFTQARLIFDWFLGRNDLGLPLYDPISGGCRDGLHVDRVNENQGAESTISFLLALVEMQTTHEEIATFKKPTAD